MPARLSPVFLVLIALPLSADTSGRRSSADPRKFIEVANYLPSRAGWLVVGGGKYVVTKNANNSVGVIEVATGKDLGDLKGHTANLHDAGYSRDGRFLVTSGFDSANKIWDLTTMKEVASINAHAGFS